VKAARAALDDNEIGRSHGPAALVEELENAAPYDPELASIQWDEPIPLEVVADLPDFPTASLPAWLRDFVEAVAVQTQTPPCAAAMLALSTVAAAVARKYEIEPKPGWREPLNLYTLTVLPPGNRKTAVVSALTKPVHAHLAARNQELAPIVAAAAQEHRVRKARVEHFEKRAAHAKTEDEAANALALAKAAREHLESMRVPTLVRELVDDVTPERLVTLLVGNDERLAVLAAEGTFAETAILSRYSEKGSDDRPTLVLSAYDGEPYESSRVGRGDESLTRPALTLGLVVQPAILDGLARRRQLRDLGLLGRFAYAIPRSLVGYRDVDPPSVSEVIASRYHGRMRALWELPTPPTSEIPALTVSIEARQVLLAYAGDLELGQRPGEAYEALADWASKHAGRVARIAAGLHIANAWRAGEVADTIGLPTIEAAIAIGRYQAAHARAAFARMGADPVIEDARAVLAVAARRGRLVERRDFQRMLRALDPERLDAAIAKLCADGWLHELRAEKVTKPKRRFAVHPKATEKNQICPYGPTSTKRVSEITHPEKDQ